MTPASRDGIPSTPSSPVRVLVVTNLYPSPDRPTYGIFVKEEIDAIQACASDIELDVLHVDGPRDRRNYWHGLREIRRRLAHSAYDVVHAHYGLTGVLARAQRRVPVMVTFRGSDVGYVRWQAALSKVLARTVDRVVVVAPWMGEALGMPDVEVVPAGLDLQLFTPGDRETACVELDLDPVVPRVLFPGSRTNPVKNVALLDAALERVRARDVEVEVSYLDGIVRERVPTLMNAADVMVMTSVAEGSPNAVKEACACNLPVVSVDVGDVREHLRGAANCHVIERDPGEIADRIMRVLESGTRSDARRNVTHLDQSALAKRLARLYREVAKR